MRVAPSLALLIVAGPLLAAGAGATDGLDCAGVADAGDDFAGATALALPVSECHGEIPVSDVDWYRFEATAGDTLRVRIQAPGGLESTDLCLYPPSNPTAPVFCQTSSSLISFAFDIAETGAWRAQLTPSQSDHDAGYILSLSLIDQVVEGVIRVGHPPIAVVRSLAHADASRFDGFDGAWVDLAQLADGTQSLEVLRTSACCTELTASFYDASNARMSAQPCAAQPSGRLWCTAPFGARKVLVEPRDGSDVSFELTYWH